VEKFNRQNVPPRPGPKIEIRRLRAGQTSTVVILSKSVWGVWTHWNGKVTEPCYEEKKKCPGCKKGLPKRWKGYLHCYDFNRRDECFVELTPISADAMACQVQAGDSLRGYRFRLQRANGDKARLSVTLLPSVEIPDLPAEKDVQVVLCRLWELDGSVAVQEGTTNLPFTDAVG
jgi:hypothetical protein